MPGMNLTRDEAAERAAHLAVRSYDVTLDVTTGDDVFRSTTLCWSRATWSACRSAA